MAKKFDKQKMADSFFNSYIARYTDDSGIAPQILAYYNPKSIIAEQYRIIRTHIQRVSPDIKILLLTSTKHGEGKTVSSTNLAVIMAKEENKKVILLDCDMRKGTAHKLMGIKQSPGLADVLSGEKTIDDVIQRNNKIPNLSIVTLGELPANPSELLASDRMKALLALLKTEYDYVILDAPPVLPVTDTHVLCSLVDGVVMIIKAGTTQREQVLHAQTLLNQVQAKIIGFVLTQVEHYLPRRFYKYFQYEDDYYYR